MNPQLWIGIAIMYLTCWVMGRMFAGVEKRDHMGTHSLLNGNIDVSYVKRASGYLPFYEYIPSIVQKILA